MLVLEPSWSTLGPEAADLNAIRRGTVGMHGSKKEKHETV